MTLTLDLLDQKSIRDLQGASRPSFASDIRFDIIDCIRFDRFDRASAYWRANIDTEFVPVCPSVTLWYYVETNAYVWKKFFHPW